MRFGYSTKAFIAIASLSGGSALAQDSTTTTTNTSNLIPVGINPACTAFMTQLNADTSIQSCTAPLLSATQFYANATAAAQTKTSASTSSSASTLTTSLSQLCKASTGCNPDLIRQYLSQFWTACDAEIRAKNKGVLDVYDVLYLLNPFHQAVCTQDDSSNYCVLNIATNTASKSANATASTSKRSLFIGEDDTQIERRQAGGSASEAAGSIDSSALSNSNIAFLFLQNTSDKSVLCSSCAKNVMAAYISFETSIPYAIGLANSDILSNQASLYNAMKSTCGASFTTAINQVAGTTAFAEVGGAASLSIRSGAFLGAATLVVALMFAM